MKKNGNKILRIPIPKTVSQSVYGYLKKSIIDCKLRADQKINEKEIADIFQVSRTPVREAIAQLAAEGFIKIDHHHGAVVKGISLEEIRNILEVLEVLDELAVEQAVDNLNAKDLRKLENFNDKMEKASQKREIEKYLNHNFEFHKTIWSSVSNDFLRENLNYCLTQFKRYMSTLTNYFKNLEFLRESMKNHEEILDRLKRKDKKNLKVLISQHWKFGDSLSSIKKELSEIQ
jgi:DNA-binding GntR family transcriptional regulator